MLNTDLLHEAITIFTFKCGVGIITRANHDDLSNIPCRYELYPVWSNFSRTFYKFSFRCFTTLIALNPAMFLYTLEGRSDVFMFAFLFGALILLKKKKFMLSGIIMALAFTVKQSVWPLLPLYIGYVHFVTKSASLTLKRLTAFFVTFLLIVLPFFLWNPQAFLNSTVFYLSGNTVNSYPISGYGLGVMLHQLGFIKDLNASYPFIFWQVIFIIPLLLLLLLFLRKNPSVKILIFTYGLLLFAYWYLSRYFNNSHVAYLTMVFLTAYFWPDEE